MAMVSIGGNAKADENIDFTLPQQQGGNWRLSEHRGEVVWVVIVAPWCGGCSDFVDRVRARVTRMATAVAANATPVPNPSHAPEGNAPPPNVVAPSVVAPSVFAPSVVVISAVDRAHDGGAVLANHQVPVLIDRQGEVLAQLAPANLPWLFLINEDGHVDAGGADIDALTRTRDGSPTLVTRLRHWWQR